MNLGDIVACKEHREMGAGRVVFIWATGNIDATYTDGRVLINWPQDCFELEGSKPNDTPTT